MISEARIREELDNLLEDATDLTELGPCEHGKVRDSYSVDGKRIIGDFFSGVGRPQQPAEGD